MTRRISYLVGMALVSISFALFWSVGCAGDEVESVEPEEQVASELVEVEVYRVASTELVERRRWSGRLEPLAERTVSASQRGMVAGLSVREGDRIQKGQVLVRIEGPAAGQRRAVHAERIDFLRQELQRWERLAEADAAGPAEVNEARLRLLEARREQAEEDSEISQEIVRAPASGRVLSVNAAEATYVATGEPILVISADELPGLRVQLPASETRFLEARQDLEARDDDGQSLTIREITYGAHDHPGFVTATIFVDDVDVDRRRQATVSYESRDDVLLVPWTAVASDDDEQWVAVVEESSGEVTRRAVSLGRAHEEGIEVLSGLEEDELVVRYEPRNIADGDEVTPRQLDDGE